MAKGLSLGRAISRRTGTTVEDEEDGLLVTTEHPRRDRVLTLSRGPQGTIGLEELLIPVA